MTYIFYSLTGRTLTTLGLESSIFVIFVTLKLPSDKGMILTNINMLDPWVV